MPTITIDDLRFDDIDTVAATLGGRLHAEHVTAQLLRVAFGEVEYLCARDGAGVAVAKAGIEFALRPGTGQIWQLCTREDLRSQGIGTALLHACEARITARGISTASLGVDVRNPRAHALYERLGYKPVGFERDGWDQLAADGSIERYETTVVLMRKVLSAGGPSSPGARLPSAL